MRLFEEVEGLVFAKLKTIKATVKLVKLEAKLARLSIYPLLLNVVLLGLTSITIWLLCMLLIGYGATFLFQSIAAGLGLLLVLNLGFLFGLFHYLKFNLRKMSFEKTRQYALGKTNKESHELKNPRDEANYKSRKDAAMATKSGDTA